MDDATRKLGDTLARRFGEAVPAAEAVREVTRIPEVWAELARRGSARKFSDRPVAPALLDTLCALALSAPTKSDLQQRDIVIVEDKAIRGRFDTLLSTGPLAQDWIPGAPVLIVFCGNNRRKRQLFEWRGRPFVNDHLDAFFNASVDAGIALMAFITAAEAAGLGCAAISAIRNHPDEVSELLGLPDHVFPVAGLGLGWPAAPPYTSLRLPLSATVHRNRFSEEGLRDKVEAYDRRRHAVAPYRSQRAVAELGKAEFYGWSEDKVRQYVRQERADWGDFVKRRGFKLE